MKRIFVLLLASVSILFLASCQPKQAALGSAENPIKMAIVPYEEAERLVADMKPVVEMLEKETGYHYDFSVVTSYAALIEGMGANKVDVGWFGPLAYVLAHEKYGANVILVSIEYGQTTYRSEIIVRTDSGINSLADLKGKRFAYVDAASASGYLYPRAMLAAAGYDPDTFFAKTTFAGSHDSAVVAVYRGDVDAGAVYEDARDAVEKALPDVMDQVKVIAYSDPIPNDNVAVRKGLPPEITNKIKQALLGMAADPEGLKVLAKAIGVDGLAPAKDSDYDPVRRAAQALRLDLESQVK
ncbi:MAG: phosphate/phosphite/phosphonate ABC transporter substrate-binding protein [Chloroflexi bacterium]|nr:phosphate/phosphite/phosphonate ABC transporter substrate-binding protein [Chloroflexota bacterium]